MLANRVFMDILVNCRATRLDRRSWLHPSTDEAVDFSLDFPQEFEQTLEIRRFAADQLLHFSVVLFQLCQTAV